MIRKTLMSIFILSSSISCQNSSAQEIGVPVLKKDEIRGLSSNGHEQGNGTDIVPFGQGSAWLLGEKEKIKYCYTVASDFGADSQTIKRNLNLAFEIWKNYIIEKDVNENLSKRVIESIRRHPPYPNEIPPEIAEKANLFKLPLASTLMDHCDGTENIKFYFGDVDELIRQLKKNYFNPIAFAFRNEYDVNTGIGKGVIWLTKEGGLGEGKGGYPHWDLPNRILGILLHEIGHFYGLGHLRNTIMEENMYGLLLGPGWTTENQALIEYKMSHIDHESELFLSNIEVNKKTYKGTMAFFLNRRPEVIRPEIEENFKFMTGRIPRGKVTSSLANKILTLSDHQSAYHFNINFVDNSSMASHQDGFSVDRKLDNVRKRASPQGNIQKWTSC